MGWQFRFSQNTKLRETGHCFAGHCHWSLLRSLFRQGGCHRSLFRRSLSLVTVLATVSPRCELFSRLDETFCRGTLHIFRWSFLPSLQIFYLSNECCPFYSIFVPFLPAVYFFPSFGPFNRIGPQNTKLISHDILENTKYETVNPHSATFENTSSFYY